MIDAKPLLGHNFWFYPKFNFFFFFSVKERKVLLSLLINFYQVTNKGQT
jgi:hypothetical protein